MSIFTFLRRLIPTVATGHQTPRVRTSVAQQTSPMGNPDPVCPYCSHTFDKMPQRKTKCAACGNVFYSRTRPQDRQRVLLRAEDLEALEEQWAIATGTHAELLEQRRRRQQTRATLHQHLGRAPTEHELDRQLLCEDGTAHARAGHWGHYRNTRLSIAKSFASEGDFQNAFNMYLEVCYIDSNGPTNRGDAQQFPDLAGQLPVFDRREAFLAPGVLDRCIKLADRLGLTLDDVGPRFLDIARPHHASLKLPVKPESAWRRLNREWQEFLSQARGVKRE